MIGRICLSDPPTGLDAYSQNALELPCRVTPALPTGFDPWTRSACADFLHTPTSSRVWRSNSGSGISTGCPSPTTFVLGLGPTNPEWTSLPQETLGIRRVRFSLTFRYSCRHSHSCTLQSSLRSTFAACRTLPYRPTAGEPAARPVASVPSLSPVGSSAQNHLTSELLRTLSMVAASEPTSWLSMRIHILYHLAWI